MDSNKKDKFTPFGSDWLIGQSGKSSDTSSIVKDIYEGIDNLADKPVDRQELLDLADEIYKANPTKTVADVIQRIFKSMKLEWKPK